MATRETLYLNLPGDTSNTYYFPGMTNVIAGTGLTGGGSAESSTGVTIALATSGVTAGSYGPTANITGSHGTTMSVPQITVDSYGRVTSIVNRTYTAQNTDTNNKLAQTKMDGDPSAQYPSYYPVICSNQVVDNFATGTYASYAMTDVTVGSNGVLLGAAWNDYAEYRETTEIIEPGRVVCENNDDTLGLSQKRLQPGAEIVSDTFGFAIGKTEKCKTPIAATGRVLAYPYEDRNTYKAGDPVCAGPNGTVSKMTREEIREYPDRMIGTVSAVPDYETWGAGNVPVNGRIWIRIK